VQFTRATDEMLVEVGKTGGTVSIMFSEVGRDQKEGPAKHQVLAGPFSGGGIVHSYGSVSLVSAVAAGWLVGIAQLTVAVIPVGRSPLIVRRAGTPDKVRIKVANCIRDVSFMLGHVPHNGGLHIVMLSTVGLTLALPYELADVQHNHRSDGAEDGHDHKQLDQGEACLATVQLLEH
jgi:hypothetical protein